MKNELWGLFKSWYEFEPHYDFLGIYDSEDLANKAKESYEQTRTCFHDFDVELYIEKLNLNEMFWTESEDTNDKDRSL